MKIHRPSRRHFFFKAFGGLVGTLAGLRRSAARAWHKLDDRARLRDLGIHLGTLPPGPNNAITDVAGVRVGHTTNIRGTDVRTGVTVILPHDGNPFEDPVAAGHFVLNGNGEMTGRLSSRARGRLETPIFLTGTANVGIVYDAALTWLLRQNPDIGLSRPVPVPVVAECWDSLGDIEGRHITEDDVLQAIESATGGAVQEGAVGGGTGMRSYGFKAGIGTASRVVGDHVVGVLVNANHSVRHLLRIDGVPVGQELGGWPESPEEKSKSIILVAATDAPLLSGQLTRMCKRMSLGLARTGSVSTHGSGDLCLAFSTAHLSESPGPTIDRSISQLWHAAVEAAEEAALNALTAAPTMKGMGGIVRHGLPLDRLVDIMKKYNRL